MSIFDRFFGEKQPANSEYEQLLERSMNELQLKTSAHDAAWRLGECSWAADLQAGELVFTRKDGITATCPVQVIGTYNTKDGSFLWGWDHPSVAAPCAEHAQLVHDYGEQHGIEQLTTRKVECTENEAWQFTALACKLASAQGAYRGPAGTTLVFMTFGDVTLSK